MVLHSDLYQNSKAFECLMVLYYDLSQNSKIFDFSWFCFMICIRIQQIFECLMVLYYDLYENPMMVLI